MIQIIVQNKLSVEMAVRGFKRLCNKSGLINRLKKIRYHEPPSLKRKNKCSNSNKMRARFRKEKIKNAHMNSEVKKKQYKIVIYDHSNESGI